MDTACGKEYERMLRITEEILLLILDTEQGNIRVSLPEHARDIVTAGAVLMDLAMEDRIDTDFQQLILVNPMPLGDDFLDPTLADIANATDTHDTAYWIARTAERGEQIRQMAINRLAARGILEIEGHGPVFFSHLVSRIRRYPSVDGTDMEDVHVRIMRVLFSQDIPDPRDALIVSLAASCGVFDSMLSSEEQAQVRDRIDQVARLDLIGRTVAAALRQHTPSARPRKPARPHQQIPCVAGWPIAGHAFAMSRDLRAFLTRQYQRHGPIFRIKAFNRRFIVLAGPEANVFVTKAEHVHLRSKELWRDFDAVTGSGRTVMSMDGPEHMRMRKVQAAGYSSKVIQNRLDDVIDITRRAIDTWPMDQAMSGLPALQRIVAEQIGLLLTSLSPLPYINDLTVFLETLLKIQVVRQWPKLMMHWPRFRQARRRVMELYAALLAAHQPENRQHRHSDFIDDLLELHGTDPQFLPETDLPVAFLGPYFAGLDTSASVCAFMLYALLKHPELLARMTAEVDALFDRGIPTAQDLSELDVTHRIALETLRMYPIIPGFTRTVSNSFEFGGYLVPAGAQVIIGNTVAHHLPECFPHPERFDIDRYQRGRAEHRKPGAFAPFGVGRHRCLGSGFAEVQIAVTMATIVRETELVLERPNRPIDIKQMPLPHPAASFKVRQVRRRRVSRTG